MHFLKHAGIAIEAHWHRMGLGDGRSEVQDWAMASAKKIIK